MHIQTILPWLVQYKYWLIFPAAIIEGPIIMIITGFLASLGVVNFIFAFVVVTIGDFIGDSVYYLIGKYGKETFIRKYGKYIGITLEREVRIENYFAQHANQTLLIGKFAHGIGSLVLVAAGLASVSYKKLLAFNGPTTAIKSLLLLLLGFYFGQIYLRLNAFLNYISLFLFAVFIFLYVVILRRKVMHDMVGEDDPVKS